MLKPLSSPVISALGIEHLSVCTALQQHVLTALHEDEAHFLVPKSRAQFWHYLNGHHATMYGIPLEAQHAAQIIMRTSADRHENTRNHSAVPTLPKGYLLIQGALSHPDYRGRGLLFFMLEFLNTQNPTASMLARVVPANVASWHVFLKAGYRIAAAEQDPDDERRVFYLVRNEAPIATKTQHVDRHDFSTIQQLCRAGWYGISYNKTAETIMLVS